MIPFVRLKALAAPIDMSDVDTDRLIPARFLRKARGDGLQRYLFHDMRFDADGAERPDFVLNQPAYRAAQILVTGANFGCGSAREAAVYVLFDHGIRAIVAPGFGDIFQGNLLQNGMLPVILPDAACEKLRRELHEGPGSSLDIDLESQTVVGPDGSSYPFAIDATTKERLLKGLDDVGLILQHIAEIEAFEDRRRADTPWQR
jgi:3-isopropylmalate/(R)-2-methylmalate dehydratase small subunit